MIVAHGDDEIPDVLRRFYPAVHEREIERVVLRVQSGGRDEVAFLQRVGDVAEREIRRRELQRIDDDVILRRSSADEIHACDAGDGEEAWLEIVAG